MRRFSKDIFLKAAALFVVWLVLSGRGNPLHVGFGLVASFGVAWLNAGRVDAPLPPIRLLRLPQYLLWMFGRIVRSGLHMTWIILHPSLPIAPRIIHYRTGLRRRAAVVLLGNSITLTPGTITAEIKNTRELVVHAIDEESGRDLTEGRLEQCIDRVFRPPAGAA